MGKAPMAPRMPPATPSRRGGFAGGAKLVSFHGSDPPHPSLSPPGAAGAFSLVRPPLPVAVPLRETFLYLYIKKNPGEKKRVQSLGGASFISQGVLIWY